MAAVTILSLASPSERGHDKVGTGHRSDDGKEAEHGNEHDRIRG